MIEYLAAATAILGLISLWLAYRGRRAWAKDARLGDIIKTHAARQVGVRLRKDSGAWMRVLESNRHRALIALRFDNENERVTARATVQRQADGSVAIRTQLLARDA